MTDPGGCVVPGCERPRHESRLYCAAHRTRLYRYGDPLGTPPPRRPDYTGRRFGTLTVHEYHQQREQWRCTCDCGAERWVRTQALKTGDTRSCGEPSRHTPAPSYDAMHHRLYNQLGPASDYPCAGARCSAQAAQWSYRHHNARQRIESDRGPWSPDPDDYEPLCVPCHKRADLAALRHEIAEANGAQPLWEEP